MERRIDDSALIKRPSKIDIEDSQTLRARVFEKILNGFARFWGSLRQASAANCVTVSGYFAPFRGPFERIPGDRLADFVLRLTGSESNLHGTRWKFQIGLNTAGIEIASGELRLNLRAQRVIPDSGGDDCMLAQQGSDVREVERRPAEMFARGKHVPEGFANADYQVCGQSHDRKLCGTAALGCGLCIVHRRRRLCHTPFLGDLGTRNVVTGQTVILRPDVGRRISRDALERTCCLTALWRISS